MLAQKNGEFLSAKVAWEREKSVMQAQLLGCNATISNQQQQLVKAGNEIKSLTEQMEDLSIKVNDKDEEIRRLGQTMLDATIQSRREMEMRLEMKDSEIQSLKHRLQTTSSSPALKKTKLPKPVPIVKAASSSRVIKKISRSKASIGRDTKDREFMFLFTGEGIDASVYVSDWRMHRVEYGQFNETHKYCVMKLHRNFGRRRSNLINVIEEYNQKAKDGFQVTLCEENQRGTTVSNIHLRKDGARNPITGKLDMDRKQRPANYRAWTNRMTKPPTGAVIIGYEDDGTHIEITAADDGNQDEIIAADGREGANNDYEGMQGACDFLNSLIQNQH